MIAPASPVGSNGAAKPIERSTDPLEYISPSRLKSFLTCRLKFYFEKVLALPRPQSPNLHLGRAVHAGLQHYNKAKWRGGDATEPAVLAAYGHAFDHPEETVLWDGLDEEATARVKGEAVLTAFLIHQQQVIEPQPMGVEVKVTAEIPGVALPVLGIIDLVKADGTTTDYKTVGSTPDLALEAWQHELQLTA